MDWLIFILVIAAAFGSLYFTHRMDRRAKDRYRKEAYRLLDLESPAKQELKDAIKGVHLYVGRFRKDREMIQLQERLQDKFHTLYE